MQFVAGRVAVLYAKLMTGRPNANGPFAPSGSNLPATRTLEGRAMADLLYVLLCGGFFVVAAWAVRACDRL
jgi:hypothetical protein